MSTKFKNVRSHILATIFISMSMAVMARASDGGLINGAGATFPYPLYSKWFDAYQKIDPAVKINYQSVGSGSGIKQFTEQTVDFGATDAPMKDEQLAGAKFAILHIPTVLGAVVVTYNVPGVDKGLRLTPEVLSAIYLGRIVSWHDAAIAKLNPSVKLPESAILVVRRSDGSGTTGIFTDYLSKVSPEWKERVGSGTAVAWPAGLGGKGNEGVSGLVKQTPGSIGYIELIYAENNKLPYAALKNRAGEFVLPSVDAVTAAAAAATSRMPDDFRISITDADGKEAYPISGFTYLLVATSMPKDKGRKIVNFLHWAMHDGQEYARNLFYAPLPAELVTKVEKKIDGIKVQ